MSVTVELQVFPDFIQTEGNVVRRNNQTLGDHVVIQKDGLKGIFHDAQVRAEVEVPDGASPFDTIGQAPAKTKGEMKTVEVGSKWALRPGTRVDVNGEEVPRYIMTNGQYTWWVLIPADEAKAEQARLDAQDEPF